MAGKKGKGGDGPVLTPISGGRKKRPTLDTKQEDPDILLPDKLANANPTSKALTSGLYQRKLLAFFAPHVLPKMFNSLMKGLQSGDARAIQQAGELYQMLGGKGGVNVNVTQSNNNKAEAVSASASKGISSPDEMFRQLAQERQERRTMGEKLPALQIEATPVEYDEVAPEEGL